jgi:hypothetical protein
MSATGAYMPPPPSGGTLQRQLTGTADSLSMSPDSEFPLYLDLGRGHDHHDYRHNFSASPEFSRNRSKDSMRDLCRPRSPSCAGTFGAGTPKALAALAALPQRGMVQPAAEVYDFRIAGARHWLSHFQRGLCAAMPLTLL